LKRLAETYGETAHYAVLDGRSVAYRSKVDPLTGGVRLTSVVGGRNPAHATAVGKLLLASALPDLEAVRAWTAGGVVERRTARTRVTAEELDDEFRVIRAQGYAVDDQENEVGINCIAFPVHLASPTVPSGAISVSAVAYRTPLSALIAAAPDIGRIVEGTA
jgi:DNA-binding IclR family transcriptional regulator